MTSLPDNYVVLDFETRSFCDLKKCGAEVYSQDPTTEVVCVGYSLNGQPGYVVSPDQFVSVIHSFILKYQPVVIAHNVAFEKAIWRNVLKWPEPPGGWYDTMASCAYRSLPLDLEKAAQVLGLHHQKQKISMAFAKPRKDGSWDERNLDEVYEYCRRDVDTEVALFKRLGMLSPDEMEVYRLDEKMNERGMAVDMDFVFDCREIVRQASRPLLEEFAGITKGFSYVTEKGRLREFPKGLKPTQDRVLPLWFQENGLNLPNMQKETIDKILGKEEEDDDIPEITDARESAEAGSKGGDTLSREVIRALEIRRVLGSSSVKKLDRIPYCVGADGRARNLIQYHGASTGRWTGRLFQVQNFPRGTVKHDVEGLVGAIQSRDYRQVEIMYGEAVASTASALRHCLVAAPGKRLLVGDFSTVEIRVNLALAGQWDKVDLLRNGGDPYLDMAAQIYQNEEMRTLPKDEAKAKYPNERQDGKNSVLGLGFQMGVAKFRKRYAPERPLEFAEHVVKTFREDWAPKIRNMWYALDEAAMETVRTGKAHDARGAALFSLEDGWLTMELPSGRRLWYWRPRIEMRPAPWDPEEDKETLIFDAKKLGKWMECYGFGGLWCNNLVQGSARDLLVYSMKMCEREGLSPVLTVHDEIVCEVDPKSAGPETIQEIMEEDAPNWARRLNIPVEAECWTGERYRK